MLAQRYPALDITFDVVDRRADLISENIDLDVRVDEVEEPHLVAHRIAESTRVLCAAPSYLERRGLPASIAELSRHDCLVLRDRNRSEWKATRARSIEGFVDEEREQARSRAMLPRSKVVKPRPASRRVRNGA